VDGGQPVTSSFTTRRARFTVAYDGTNLSGFAEQPGERTVLGELRRAVELVVRGPANLVGAGRTDAGVHGWGQVVSCDIPVDFDLAKLQRRVNSMCRPDIAVREFQWTDDPEFHARYSATSRLYRYHVLNSTSLNPFAVRTAWHVMQPLQLWAMNLACDPLIDWKEVRGDVPGLLRFEIEANAFCHQMVRSIVGTLVEVGMGKLHAGEMRGILHGQDRQFAGRVAPAHGLVLWEVGYPVNLRR